MAFDYRSVQAPSVLDGPNTLPDNGAASAAQALAGAFKSFGDTSAAIGVGAQRKLGQQTGAADGSSGKPDYKTGLLGLTAYGDAYNNSATRSYAIQAEATAEDTAAKLQTEANNDPTLFASTYGAARDATLKAAPVEAQAAIADMYNTRMASGVQTLSMGQAQQIQKNDRINLSEGVARQTDRVAQLRSAGDPDSMNQADEEQVKLNLLIDGARNTNTITQQEQQAMHVSSQKAIMTQSVEAQFQRVLQDPHANPVDFIQNFEAQNRNGGTSLDTHKYTLQPGNAAAANPGQWDKREDGSQKGNGFLGLLQRPDGGVSSEISIGVEVNGKEMEVPTMVPTLTQKELDYLMTNKPDPSKMPKSIVQKAIAFAQQRIQSGQPVFAGPGDTVAPGGATSILDPDEEKQIKQNLFSNLRQFNEMQSMNRRNGKTEEQLRLEAGDRSYTAQMFSGTLTLQKLTDAVTSQNLKPETARALATEMSSGSVVKSDPKTLFDVSTSLLENTPQQIASNPRLSWEDKSRLTGELATRSAGWEGTQNAREGRERIDRALGIVPGTLTMTLTDAEKRQRQDATTLWYNKMSEIPPATREAQAIPVAQSVISATIRTNKTNQAQTIQQRLDAYKKLQGDPSKMDTESLKRFKQTTGMYESQITAAQAEAARQTQ